MSKSISIISIFLFGVFQFVLGQELDQKPSRQQAIYAAFGSPSLYSSVNYEISVFERSNYTLLPRVGIGFNIFQPSVGKEWNLNSGITGLYGKKKSKIEATLGWVHQLYPSYSYEQGKDVTKYKRIIYTGVGYRYQPQKKGIMFKFLITPTITLNPDKWEFFPLAELGLGYAFRKE